MTPKGKLARKLQHDDDDASSSSSSLNLPTTFNKSEIEQLVDQLTELGFDCAMRFVSSNDPERIRAAVERALSRPTGTIKNLAGYIRYLVKTPGAIPPPNHKVKDKLEADKYIRGKYEHLVKR